MLDYQWQEVAIAFWKDIEARARDAGVKVCIEMHPHNIVYNPGTLERLGDLVYHAAAKDTRINEQNCRVYGVLDDRFRRVPAEENLKAAAAAAGV